MAIDSCLVDTNILLRMTRQSDAQHKVVVSIENAQSTSPNFSDS